MAAGSQVAVTRDTGLLDTGLLNSINLVGLIQFLEDHFAIKIPDSDIGADLFTSPATLIDYVEKRNRLCDEGLGCFHKLATKHLARGALGKFIAEFD